MLLTLLIKINAPSGPLDSTCVFFFSHSLVLSVPHATPCTLLHSCAPAKKAASRCSHVYLRRQRTWKFISVSAEKNPWVMWNHGQSWPRWRHAWFTPHLLINSTSTLAFCNQRSSMLSLLFAALSACCEFVSAQWKCVHSRFRIPLCANCTL